MTPSREPDGARLLAVDASWFPGRPPTGPTTFLATASGLRPRSDAEIDPDAPEPDDEPTGASVKVRLSRAQVAAFVRHSRELVAAGRPPCRFCGLPVDPDGHPFCLCPPQE